MKNLKIILLLILVIVPFVSSAGLYIQESDIQINKTNDVTQALQIQITNQESFSFYNITTDNDIIEFEPFSLNAGETKTFDAEITTNENYDGEIRFQADYYADLGASNDTTEVTIQTSGLDICDLNLIQGDSIKWVNTLEGDVRLRNIDTNEYFQDISGNSQYTEIFSVPQTLNYQVFKVGLPISQECVLNVQPTQGYIHNINYDFVLNLDLNIEFEATNLTATFYSDSYNLDYNEQIQDVFLLKNTGTKTAKNIELTGEWFEFTKNNFDLDAGQQLAIGYTIKPIITNTNQTNITHTKTIAINGNFNTIEKDVDVFINYKKISDSVGEFLFDLDSALNFVNLLCLQYPDTDECKILSGDFSSLDGGNVSIEVGKDAYLEGLLAEDEFREEMRTFLRQQNEILGGFNSSLSGIESNNNETQNKLSDVLSENESLRGNMIFVLAFMLGVIGIILLVFLIRESTGKNHLRNFFKGEKTW